MRLMIALSVLPALPILLPGSVIAFDGFWSAITGDLEQLLQLFMWVFGVCGVAGLSMASLESFNLKTAQRVLTVTLVVFGMFAVALSFYYVFLVLPVESNVDHKNLANQNHQSIHLFLVIWLLLLWPFFSGLLVIKKFIFDKI